MTDSGKRTEWPRVRAVVLNYNGYPHVLKSVAALAKTDWPADRLEIVVVDNGSSDDSVADIVEEFPQVSIRENPANNGFPANNLAMVDRTGVDYIALINNDAFVEPGWLAPLVQALETDPELGTASAKILFAPRYGLVHFSSSTFLPGVDTRTLGIQVGGVRVDGIDAWDRTQLGKGFWHVEHGGGRMYAWTDGEADLHLPFDVDGSRGTGAIAVQLSSNTKREVTVSFGGRSERVVVSEEPEWVEFEVDLPLYDIVNNAGNVLIEGGFGADRAFKKVDDGSYDRPTDVFAWCGNGVLFRMSYLQDVGLFDESFFAYYEDMDMAWRGQARGWRHRYVPTSRIRHMHATTSGAGSDLFMHYVERNRLLTLVKNAPAGYAAEAVGRYLLSTGGYVRHDVLHPLSERRRPNLRPTVRRMRSFGGFLKQLQPALVQRKVNRKQQIVPDSEILKWSISREDFE